MMNNYQEFLLESLLLESKLELSDKLYSLLRGMPNNRIKDILIKFKDDKIDNPYIQNYLDIGSNKEEISFLPDRRAQQIMADQGNLKWMTTEEAGNKYLTFSKNQEGEYKNKILFDALGFQPTGGPDDNPIPGRGKVGEVLSETTSRVSGKTFVLFEWEENGEKHKIALNKTCLVPHDDRITRLWTSGRNPIRVGRLVRAVLTAGGEKFTDQEVEEFVNMYKSAYDIMNDAFLKFSVVKGNDIAYWYNLRRYESEESSLGNSCMAEVSSDYFDIYTENPEVCSLVILYSENGQIENGKWKSNKIRGRALLWKTDDGDTFMDRIYTNYDSDIDLFKQYAERNGWWCKRNQNSERQFTAIKGSETKRNPVYVVSLKKSEFDYYPYVDTLSYINVDTGKISNGYIDISADHEMNSTSGYLEEF